MRSVQRIGNRLMVLIPMEEYQRLVESQLVNRAWLADKQKVTLSALSRKPWLSPSCNQQKGVRNALWSRAEAEQWISVPLDVRERQYKNQVSKGENQ